MRGTELRDELLKAIKDAKAELAKLDELHGQMGHNGPPDEERLAPIDQPERDGLLEDLEKLETQARSAKPDEAEVKAVTSSLRSAASWIWNKAGQKVDKATDKLSENIVVAAVLAGKDGPSPYHWIHQTALSLCHKLLAVAHAADLWLGSIHLPPF